MANDFVNLPAPAANGSGAEVDVSALGALKTIVCKIPQANGVASAQVLIEYSNDDAFQIWSPLVRFTKPGIQQVKVAARYMRATVTNYAGAGAPDVNVGAAEGTVTFAELIAPAGNGQGAAVDTSALPLFKTIQVNGTFKGVCNIEVSCDAGTSWATVASFQQKGGTWSGEVAAERMRISRSGILAREASPGTFTCDIGSVELAGGGGGLEAVTTRTGSLVGDGTSGDPLGAHVFVWEVGVTWATIYAAMTAVPGPKICLVEWEYGGTRQIGPAAAYNINEIRFEALGIPGGSAEAVIQIVDGVTFSTQDFGGGQQFGFLLSKNIYWNPVCTTTPIYTSAVNNRVFWIDLDGGGIFSANTVIDGSVALYLRNRANANSTAGAGGGMFRVRNGNDEVYLLSGSELRNRVFFDPDGLGFALAVNMDGSTRYQDASNAVPSFEFGNITVTTTMRVFMNRANELFSVNIDGGGGVTATPL